MAERRALARRLVIYSDLANLSQLYSSADTAAAAAAYMAKSPIVGGMIISVGAIALAVPTSIGLAALPVIKLQLRRFIGKMPISKQILQELTKRIKTISIKEWEYFSRYYLRLLHVEIMGAAICYDLLEDRKQALLKFWATDHKNSDVVKKIEYLVKKFENDKSNPFVPQKDFWREIKNIIDDHIFTKDDYQDLIDVLIPDNENWETFCDEFLQLPHCVISLCKLYYDGKYFKLSTLKIWESWNETVNECKVENEDFSDTEQSLSKRAYRLAKRFISERAIEQKFVPLVNELIPKIEDWKIFSTHYLNLEPSDVGKILKLELDETAIKFQTLRIWRVKNHEDDENELFKLAKNFIKESALFQFMSELITDNKAWKSFARDQLQLEKNEYKDYINGRELTIDMKMQMLWDWRRKNKDKNLCEMLQTHLSNNSTLLAAIRAIPSQLTSRVTDMISDLRQVNVTVNGNVKAEKFCGYKVTNNYSKGSKV